MELKEYILDKNALVYDFSNDGACKAYTIMDNMLNTFEKFFSYMAVAKHYKCDKDNIMKYGALYSTNCSKIMGKIPDPDSQSLMLQEIYCFLWRKECLSYCKNNTGISGETLFSMNTTLCELYKKYIETDSEKDERESIKDPKQDVSIRYILSRYVKNDLECVTKLDSIRGLKRMLALYHTLGNFMPFPNGCNPKRGIGKTKDYPDLMLHIIYEFFFNISNRLVDVVGNEKSVLFKEWIESYGKTANGWNKFVDSNFLQDFVNRNEEGYGVPIELWQGHYKSDVLPNEKSQIESFYTNGTSMIVARTSRMLIALQTVLGI